MTSLASWYNDTTFKEDYDTGKVTVRKNAPTEQYLMYGWCIYGKPAYFSDWLRGTPFTTIEALKRAKKEADIMASWNGWDTKVELWKETSMSFVPVNINRKTNRLENLDPKKFRDPEDGYDDED